MQEGWNRTDKLGHVCTVSCDPSCVHLGAHSTWDSESFLSLLERIHFDLGFGVKGDNIMSFSLERELLKNVCLLFINFFKKFV